MSKRNAQTPLYEQLLKALKGQIVSGVYQKGDLLPSEKELIDAYGVSRITVRRTLALLAEMGFIETSKGKGSVVLFSPQYVKEDGGFAEAVEEYYKDFLEASQIRLLLEPEIAKTVAGTATKKQIAYLKDCLEKEEENYLEDFHRGLVEVLGNKTLSEMMDRLLGMENTVAALGIIQPERRKEVADILESQHWKIFEAIQEKNEEFAYFYMKEHTVYICGLYQKYYEQLGR